jgi:Tol biopolymer transport system component
MGKRFLAIIIFLLLVLQGCLNKPDNVIHEDNFPDIWPNYVNVTIPANIAPLNFKLKEKSDRIEVQISGKKRTISLKSEYKIRIPEKKWRTLLEECKGDSLSVKVTAFTGGECRKYRSFNWYVNEDEIDPYLSYRLIEPGYEVWSRLSIRQRNITNFNEKVLIDNNLIDDGCINCHIYSMQDPNLSFFHLRHKDGGTIIQKNGKIRKIDTRSDSTISAGVYGNWHPSGKYIAFSTNVIIPEFHSIKNKRLEVYDTISDVVVLDIERNEIITSKLISAKNSFETFPVFSSDGRRLFFCSARALRMPENYQSARYSLCAIDFDQETGKFGAVVDTLVSSFRTGKTVSQPKTSADGRYLMFTSFDYGNFPVWHMEADLCLLNLNTGSVDSLESVNSRKADSYHSWSSDSRWFVFASKRDDGMYGKPYFAYIDENGKSTKAFVLPQRDPDFYDYSLKSYNIPELSKGPAPFTPYDIEKALKSLKAEKVRFVRK